MTQAAKLLSTIEAALPALRWRTEPIKEDYRACGFIGEGVSPILRVTVVEWPIDGGFGYDGAAACVVEGAPTVVRLPRELAREAVAAARRALEARS